MGKHIAPSIRGFHSEREEKDIRGCHIQTLRKERAAGVGNIEWVKVGRWVLYADGSAERYAERQLRAKLDEAAPVRPRGRPRKARGASDAAD
jgi:hypothetical protein